LVPDRGSFESLVSFAGLRPGNTVAYSTGLATGEALQGIAVKARTLDEARAAKTEATHRFGVLASVVGVGITRIGDGFGLKINLSEQPKVALPTEVGGVPVLVEVVGPIRKR
jgi:hypothetical protein